MVGLVKTALTALSAYLQLRNKSFYYNITQESREKQLKLINEIEELRSKRTNAATERADLLQQQLLAEKRYIKHISTFYNNIEPGDDDSN
jgi:hypothetical protein